MSRIESGIYHLPLGADYPTEVARGLKRRLEDDPVALARVNLFVNSREMSKAVLSALSADGATFLPRVRLVDQLAKEPTPEDGSEDESLKRVLEAARLISKIPEAGSHALFETAEALIELVDEVYGDGLDLSALENIGVEDHACHRSMNLAFLKAAKKFLKHPGQEGPGAARRAATEKLIDAWRETPPEEPVILCGSTLSLSTTALLAEAIATLPQGAVILPGVVADLSPEDWSALEQNANHPQSRFAPFMKAREDGTAPRPWTEAEPSPRIKLLSLALRPAPVTDSWMRDGPALGSMAPLTEGLTLIEAPDPRAEALAIAVAARQAVERDESVSIVSMDRTLARRVAAALDEWGIVADESTGTALSVTSAGRLLRKIMRSLFEAWTSAGLIDLLKNPLCSLSAERHGHLRETRDLERWLRGKSVVWPKRENLEAWAGERGDDAQAFANSLAGALPKPMPPEAGFEDVLAEIRRRLDKFAPDLARETDGQNIVQYLENIAGSDPKGDKYGTADIVRLIERGLSGKSIPLDQRDRHSIRIVGPLQARAEQSDLTILGGLNENKWPAQPAPDPWLSHRMREQAGLAPPDARIGVEAHDFQNAAARPRVVLSRARRDGEAQTIPSRWLNRLTGLIDGLNETGGPEALKAMRDRGNLLLDMARAFDDPGEKTPRAPRPCPAPPVTARPSKLWVTNIKTLILDPYEIYARHVLRLKPLDPIRPEPGALQRGIMIHEILEAFIQETKSDWPENPGDLLRQIARNILNERVPWASARRYWAARIDIVADWFVEEESKRRENRAVLELEVKGELEIPDLNFTLSAKADRLDQILASRKLAIYDYKSGSPPSENDMRFFDKQLHLEAMMAEKGAFEKIGRTRVSVISHICLGRNPLQRKYELDSSHKKNTFDGLRRLIKAYSNPDLGYLAKRIVKKDGYGSHYDHLSRYGEWDSTDQAETEKW